MRFFAASLLLFVLGGCDRPAEVIRPSQEEPHLNKQERPQTDTPSARMHTRANGQLGPGRGTLIIDLKPPAGAELTQGAPFRVQARGDDLKFPESINTKLNVESLPARLPIDVADGALGPAEVDLTFYYCHKGPDASCRPEKAKLEVELDLSGASAGGEAHIIHQPQG